jgi:UDP-GlcNAc:undecaprenyl-phosphate/decaprenyl-phosphate GlcNAc-1-phosphate transferase
VRILALVGIILGWSGLTLAYSASVPRGRRLLTARNYRGAELPLTLGWGLALLIFWPLVFRAGWIIDASLTTTFDERFTIASSMALVALAGWYDDFRGGAGRGIRFHLNELARRRITSGVVKLMVIVGAAGSVSITLGSGPARILLGIPVIAGSANLWNLLDVRPGRALKFFLVAALALVGWYARYDDYLLAAAIGSAAALLTFDLRERAMLGDAGSNLLGFIIGLALFRLLPTWGLAVALILILVLHALGETVTLSRIIEATPPLRWFDRLGRLPDRPEPESERATRDSSAT